MVGGEDHPMQMLRAGGDYLVGERRKAGTLLLTIASAGAAVATALGVSLHPLAAAVAGIVVAPAAAKAYRRRRRFQKGIQGESAVAELLQSLPNDYFLLNDVVLPGHSGNIDHVVIGPCGVVVIETKNHPRHVQNRAAIAVREALTRVHPELGDSVLRFVDSVAVFTNPSSRLRVDRVQTTIARYSQLLDVILAKARRKRVAPAVAARLAKSLLEVLPDGAAPAPGTRALATSGSRG
jgi:Nuclease-related domain